MRQASSGYLQRFHNTAYFSIQQRDQAWCLLHAAAAYCTTVQNYNCKDKKKELYYMWEQKYFFYLWEKKNVAVLINILRTQTQMKGLYWRGVRMKGFNGPVKTNKEEHKWRYNLGWADWLFDFTPLYCCFWGFFCCFVLLFVMIIIYPVFCEEVYTASTKLQSGG